MNESVKFSQKERGVNEALEKMNDYCVELKELLRAEYREDLHLVYDSIIFIRNCIFEKDYIIKVGCESYKDYPLELRQIAESAVEKRLNDLQKRVDAIANKIVHLSAVASFEQLPLNLKPNDIVFRKELGFIVTDEKKEQLLQWSVYEFTDEESELLSLFKQIIPRLRKANENNVYVREFISTFLNRMPGIGYENVNNIPMVFLRLKHKPESVMQKEREEAIRAAAQERKEYNDMMHEKYGI